MSSSSSTYHSVQERPILCDCGSFVKLSQSWTDKNPGRRFYACPNFDPITKKRCCKVWNWQDEVMTIWQRDIIVGLKHEKQRLQMENEEMRKALVAAEIQARNLQTQVIMLKVKKGEGNVKVATKPRCLQYALVIFGLVLLTAAILVAIV